MTWPHRISSLLRNLFRKEHVEQELDEEVRAHLGMLVDEKVAAGMSLKEAYRAARIELGGIDLVKARVREVRVGAMLEQVWQDSRYGVRMLRKNPGFTVVAVVTLALGIGANSAIFSVVNGVLLRPLPYQDAAHLAMIWHNNTKEHKSQDWMAYQTLLDLREQNKSFEDMAGMTLLWRFGLATAEGQETLQGYWVSASFFSLLGVEPFRGRAFLPEEDKPGGTPAVILSHHLWQNAFGADPNILGRTVTLDSRVAPVVGVMPAAFRFMDDADLWMPLAQNPVFARGPRSVRVVSAIGRLAPGAKLPEARAEMEAIAGRLAQAYPDTNTGLDVSVVQLQEQIVGKVRPALLVLLGAVGFVLLITCTNMANLLVARASARETEIAVRLALGAGGGRLVRQLLTESVVLGLAGGVAGLILALAGLRLLRSIGPAELPRMQEISIDGNVLVFTLAISVLTGLTFGLLPAFQVLRVDMGNSLKGGSRTTNGGGRSRSTLVVTEVALALVMLVGAGLMIRSFTRLMRVDPGFNSDHLLTLQMDVPPAYGATPEKRIALYDEIFERLEALPGVKSAGGVTRLPLGTGSSTKLEIEGRPVAPGEEPEVEFRRASKHYFQAMGIPLRDGRTFTEQDGPAAPKVAVINEVSAKRFWAGEDPMGRHVRFAGDSNAPWFTVVGIVGDVKHFGLDLQAPAELYMSFDQGPPGGPRLAIRTSTDPASLIPSVRSELRAIDKQIAISQLETMDEIVSKSTADRRFQALLLGAFAALALALAMIGIYGVMAYGVAQRTHELAIRIALGAGRIDVIRLVLGQGMRLVIVGVAIGLAGAFGLTRFLRTLLFEIEPTDPVTFVGVSILLALVALLACYVPARRASRVDPLAGLRCQ